MQENLIPPADGQVFMSSLYKKKTWNGQNSFKSEDESFDPDHRPISLKIPRTREQTLKRTHYSFWDQLNWSVQLVLNVVWFSLDSEGFSSVNHCLSSIAYIFLQNNQKTKPANQNVQKTNEK